MSEYQYRQDDDGYNVGCDCCGHIAPVSDFSHQKSGPARSSPRWLCELCAGSFVANMNEYPRQYDHSVAVLGQSVAQMLNMVLDQITGRKPPQETE